MLSGMSVFAWVENNLYDLEADPGQTINIADKHPKVVKSMREAYESFWKETRPLMVNEEVSMSATRPYHVLYEKQLKNEGITIWRKPHL